MIFFKVLTAHELAVAILIGVLLGVIYAGASINYIQKDSSATAIKVVDTPAPVYVTVVETSNAPVLTPVAAVTASPYTEAEGSVAQTVSMAYSLFGIMIIGIGLMMILLDAFNRV
jgi:hypothetical protein